MFFCVGRILSVLVTFAFYAAVRDRNTMLCVVFAITMAHYVIAYVYSPKNVAGLFGNYKQVMALLVLAAGCFLTAGFEILAISFYFGMHAALSDAYLRKREFALAQTTMPKEAYSAAFCANMFLFLFICRYDPKMLEEIGVGPGILGYAFFGAVFSYFLLFYLFYTHRKVIDKNTLLSIGCFEFVGFLLLGVSAVFGRYRFVPWESTVLYHVIFWLLIPLADPNALKKFKVKGRYLIWHFALLLLFLMITPIFDRFWKTWDISQVRTTLIFWGHIHITLSFGLSAMNPDWISRAFDFFRAGKVSYVKKSGPA